MSVNSHSGARVEPRKQPGQDRSRRTVDAILDAAARMFSERGYAGTTTNNVAETAGVSIGSLYQYFPNKDALLVALEEHHLHEASARLAISAERWRLDRPAPAEWVTSLVDTLIEVNDSPLHVLIYDTAPPLARLVQLSDALVEALAAETAIHLRRWGHRSQAGLRARVVVVAALRLVHDLAIRAQAGPRRARVRREIVRLIESSILAGVDQPSMPNQRPGSAQEVR